MLLFDFLNHLLHPAWWETALQSFGWLAYPILFAVIFAETGLLMGFFLPGDSLLFITGFVASTGRLNLFILMTLLSVAAIAGDALNFFIGKWMGHRICQKEDTWWFKKEHISRTKVFYEKHGGKTIVMARFAPIIRTFAPFVAGMANMNYTRFFIYNVFGGLLWITTMMVSGYYLGALPWVKAHFEQVVLGIIFVSLLPFFMQWIKARQEAKSKAVLLG